MATYSITGTCVYCGQMATLNASEPMDGAEADKYISWHCSCDQARHMRNANEMYGKIESLVGSECSQYGFTPESDEVCTMLAGLVRVVADGLANNITLKLPCGDTCKINTDKDGNPQVARTLKRIRKMQYGLD